MWRRANRAAGRRRWGVGAAFFVALAGTAGQGCDRPETREKPEDWDEFLDGTVIATAGDVTMTARDLHDRLRLGYSDLVSGYSVATERSIRDVLRIDVENILLSAEAERVGYADTSRSFAVGFKHARRNILQQFFTTEVLYQEIEPSEQEIRQRYEDGKEAYAVPRRSVIQHILVATKAEAEAALERIEGGEPFNDVVADVTLDEMNNITGSVGWVQEGVPIRGSGELPEFTKNALELQVGEYRIIETKRGWHVITCFRREESGYRPYEEVREPILSTLRRQRQATHLDLKLREFRARHGARVYDENLAAYLAWRRSKPESELWAKAQAEQDPNAKIVVYKNYLETFPQSEHACEARFMIGFTYAEELYDRNRARLELRDFIKECPESRLVESAEFLIEELTSAPR